MSQKVLCLLVPPCSVLGLCCKLHPGLSLPAQDGASRSSWLQLPSVDQGGERGGGRGRFSKVTVDPTDKLGSDIKLTVSEVVSKLNALVFWRGC